MVDSRASVLFVSNGKSQILNLGVDQVTIKNFLNIDFLKKYSAIIIDNITGNQSELKQVSEKIKNTSLLANCIYLVKEINTQNIELVNQSSTSAILTQQEIEHELEAEVKKIIVAERQEQQSLQAFELLKEQNIRLKQLQNALKDNIEKIESSLGKSQNRQKKITDKLDVIHKLLLNLHKAENLFELEEILLKKLNPLIKLTGVKIKFQQQTSMPDTPMQKNVFVSELDHGIHKLGNVIYIKNSVDEFTGDEKKFLTEVNETVSLSALQLITFEKKLNLMQQWEAAFKAFGDNIAIIDESYNLIQSNHSAFSGIQKNQKCYKIFFQRNEICEGCNRGKNFNIKNKNKVFSVHSQKINFNNKLTHAHVYQDITQRLSFERQLVETAKMAELGTIGSSIAHEINNPLGGMINFLQLIKMECSGTESFYSDIIEMEKAATKCKNIVKNLLGFSRESELETENTISLNRCIEQAVQIIELKTRAMGIKIKISGANKNIFIKGKHNSLTHAIKNILQNSQEAISEKRLKNVNFRGEIKITISKIENHTVIEFEDDGVGISHQDIDSVFSPMFTTKDSRLHSGLGLTLAQKIISEHDGLISINSENSSGTRISIRLPLAEPVS